jgi:lysozyme
MDGHKYTALFEAPNGKPILQAYPDPITRGSPWTIGLGHTGPEVHQDTVWTEDQCWHAFANDYLQAQSHAAQVIGTSCWARLNNQRRAVLADMAFNIGATRLGGFHKMLAAIRQGNWSLAKAELLDSDYAGQVKTRATTNAQALLTGAWPDEAAVS